MECRLSSPRHQQRATPPADSAPLEVEKQAQESTEVQQKSKEAQTKEPKFRSPEEAPRQPARKKSFLDDLDGLDDARSQTMPKRCPNDAHRAIVHKCLAFTALYPVTDVLSTSCFPDPPWPVASCDRVNAKSSQLSSDAGSVMPPNKSFRVSVRDAQPLHPSVSPLSSLSHRSLLFSFFSRRHRY
jgi:hypothetical protein